jgi:putative phage-type endonuclease
MLPMKNGVVSIQGACHRTKKELVKMDWTKEQIEARKTYIGGSDAAAILGLSRYRTPLEVWAIKTGQVTPLDISDNTPVKLGNKLEQAVAEFFMDETGKKVVPAEKMFFHPKYPFLGANIDRLVVGEPAGLECKTANQFKMSEWQVEEIPQEYQVQCLHYMAVTGLPIWYIAVLIGNTSFLWKVFVRADAKVSLPDMPKEYINVVAPETLNNIVEKEVYFWNTFIVPKVMPMQVTSQDDDILYRLYPQAASESIIELGDDASRVCESLDSMQADYAVLEKEIDEQKNTLRAMLKTYETGVTAKYRITWKNQKERRVDVELFKKEEPGLYEKYAKPKDKRVLRISVKK